MNREEIEKDPFKNGMLCAQAGMSIHANPFRNTPTGDGEACKEWIRGWKSFLEEQELQG